MQQHRHRLRYDRPVDGRSDGLHLAVTTDLSGDRLHLRTVPDPVDRMRGRDETYNAMRVPADRAERWVGALRDADCPQGYVGATDGRLHGYRVYDDGIDHCLVAGDLPPAVRVVVEDMVAYADRYLGDVDPLHR